mgnify:CR=1 FL=1
MTEETHTINTNKWIDKYADYLFNYAIVRVNDSDNAKDLVQDTFFAGLKSAKNFQGKSTERTWLVSILISLFFSSLKQTRPNSAQTMVNMLLKPNVNIGKDAKA